MSAWKTCVFHGVQYAPNGEPCVECREMRRWRPGDGAQRWWAEFFYELRHPTVWPFICGVLIAALVLNRCG